MSENVSTFNGSVPRNYEDYLGPLLFESYAQDLAYSLGNIKNSKVLELAAGTGRLTRHLVSQLDFSSTLTATDLNADMLEVGKEKVKDERIDWNVVDMMAIPYPDESFDLIVCQFGLMLVPDQLKALSEIYRVLKKGGKVVYSVWGEITSNGIWYIGAQVVKSFLGIDPIMQNPGPFSMQDESLVSEMMSQTGFVKTTIDRVGKTGELEKAALAARGFIQGLPIYMIIKTKNPELIDQIEPALGKALAEQLGDEPMRTPLYTLVITAQK